MPRKASAQALQAAFVLDRLSTRSEDQTCSIVAGDCPGLSKGLGAFADDSVYGSDAFFRSDSNSGPFRFCDVSAGR